MARILEEIAQEYARVELRRGSGVFACHNRPPKSS
jgi:hypothetical protein